MIAWASAGLRLSDGIRPEGRTARGSWRNELRLAKPYFPAASHEAALERALEAQKKEFKGLFIFRDLCIAGSLSEAEDRIRQGYERRYERYQRWGQPGERYDLKYDELKQDRLIVGSPAQVAEQVISYHEEFGAEFMWFFVDWPGMDPKFTLESIQRFGEEVIPQIKRVIPTSSLP